MSSALGILASCAAIGSSLTLVAHTGWCVWHETTARSQRDSELLAQQEQLHLVYGELTSGSQYDSQMLQECCADILAPATLQMIERRGLPLHPVLSAVQESLRAQHHHVRSMHTQVAGIRASAIVMSLLPLMGILLGYAVGAHPVQFYAHGLGSAVLMAGVVVHSLGVRWVLRMIRQLPEPQSQQATELVIAAALLESGIPVHRLYELTALSPQGSAGRLISRAIHTGAHIAQALRDFSAEEYRREEEESAAAIAETGVLLTRPLAVCFLPAFLLLGVIPIVLELGGVYLSAR